MKCIYCGTDSTYQDRAKNNSACKACKHPFAFEPRGASPRVTDGLFQRVIKDVSGDGTVSFTEDQLWYELNRRIVRRRFWHGTWGAVAGISGLGGAGLTALLLSTGPVALVPLACGAGGLVYAAVMNGKARKSAPLYVEISRPKFLSDYLGKWVHAHGRPEKLLPDVDRHPAAAAPLAPDVTSYSFDRALVTDRAETAAMLVANNFHFENNCAILSEDGYPFHARDTVLTMLRRNPALKVFVLHDASPPGCALPQTLRSMEWFSDTDIAVIDLGLRPQHAMRSRMILRQEEGRVYGPEKLPGLTPEERAWMEEGNVAELAAMRPARLMRAIYQGFARANQAVPAGGADVSTADGGIIWVYDGGADVYAADSFG